MSFKLSAAVLAATVAIGSGLAATPAFAATPVSELKDVSPDHWAYNAIQTLVDKYKVMEGYPDRTFRGSKTVTRFELAAVLARVMAKVEQRIAQAKGGATSVESGVNPEDLRTIARLQREFREELDMLKSRVDTMDARLMVLEKRVRLSGKLRTDYRDFTSGDLAGMPWADFRVRNSLNLDAQLMDDVAYVGQLNVDLYNPQSLANPYLRGSATAGMNGALTDVYMPKNYITYTPGWTNFAMGIGAIRDHLTLGSSLADPFRLNLWTNATGGYGFAGTPGMNIGGTSVATLTTPNASPGAPVWLPGTNVNVDMHDPNNSQAFMPTGSLFLADQFALGPVRLGFGFQRGALTGPALQPGATTALPTTIPGFSTWDMASRAYGTLGFDLGMAHLSFATSAPTQSYSLLGLRDKTVSASLDLGSDALALSGEVLANTDFNLSNFAATKGSLRLSSLNLFDSGFGLALGGVSGVAVGVPPLGSGFTTAKNLFIGTADYTSLGAVLKTPGFFILPSLTLAAQNTGANLSAAGLGTPAIASGLTASGEFNLFGLPTLAVEYSAGKFGTGADQSLWSAAPFNNQQVTVSTSVRY